LYAAAARELSELVASAGQKSASSRLMTIDLVSSREEQLLSALERSVTDFGVGNKFGFDPATVARCREALALREECEEGGIFAAARAIVAARLQDNNSAVARLLKQRLQEGSKRVRLMSGNEIDRDSLSLNL
jgi:hypothetical protein